MADGGDIIIKGGSVIIEYDDSIYPPEPGNPGVHKGNKTIRKFTIADERGNTKYDSGADNVSMWRVTVSCD